MARSVVESGIGALRAAGGPDEAQVLAYDVSHAAAAVRTAESVLAYGAHGDTEARIACAFVADALAELAGRIVGPVGRVGGRPRLDGPGRSRSSPPTGTRPSWPRWPRPRASATSIPTSSWSATRSTASPTSRSGPGPSTSTGPTPTSPRRSSTAWPRWAASACRSPRSTAASPRKATPTTCRMVVATEELTWGSLGAGGSLITRPEILTRAIVKGGTEEQKQYWLPKLATAEVLGAVAVTEPDYGSDVAGVMLPATKVDGGWILNGVKTWCTFAARAERPAAAGPHRSRPRPRATGACRSSWWRSLRPTATASPSPRQPGRDRTARRLGREDGGAGHRHHRLPGHALLRGVARELVRAGRQPHRRRVGPGPGLLPPDAGIRERAAADGGPRRRPHAGRLRGGRSSTPPTGSSSARPSATTS